MWLALAVANSRFIEDFYDHRFHNKLYSGRRRFMTQYVELFPLPNPESEFAKRMSGSQKHMYANMPSSAQTSLVTELDELVFRAFGLPVEKATR